MNRILLAVVIGLIALFAPVVASCQGTSPAAPAATSSSSPQPDNSSSMNSLRQGMKAMTDGSGTMLGWSLIIIAASVTAIVSTTYLRPLSRRLRLIYLFFIPGWVCLGLSIYYGNLISRRFIASVFARDESLIKQIGGAINSDFAAQISWTEYGLLFFAIWLVAFLISWVFSDSYQAARP